MCVISYFTLLTPIPLFFSLSAHAHTHTNLSPIRCFQAKDSSVELSWPVQCVPGVFAEVDKHKLSQVLRNFVSNALKFTHRNGTVRNGRVKITACVITSTEPPSAREYALQPYDHSPDLPPSSTTAADQQSTFPSSSSCNNHQCGISRMGDTCGTGTTVTNTLTNTGSLTVRSQQQAWGRESRTDSQNKSFESEGLGMAARGLEAVLEAEYDCTPTKDTYRSPPRRKPVTAGTSTTAAAPAAPAAVGKTTKSAWAASPPTSPSQNQHQYGHQAGHSHSSPQPLFTRRDRQHNNCNSAATAGGPDSPVGASFRGIDLDRDGSENGGSVLGDHHSPSTPKSPNKYFQHQFSGGASTGMFSRDSFDFSAIGIGIRRIFSTDTERPMRIFPKSTMVRIIVTDTGPGITKVILYIYSALSHI